MATWTLYQQLRELYRQHGVSRPIWKIYSEASLGKAYYTDLGVPRFMQQHPEIPKSINGAAMEAYYGGRSEVDVRLHPIEGMYLDFKSEYPTVNALMDLQSLLLSEAIEVRACADAMRTWLTHLTIQELQQPATWHKLRVLVRIRPDGDLLPVRTTFGNGAAATNIALAHLCGRIPTWYALADVINSVLHTGKVPTIVDAIELVPHGRVQSNPIKLFDEDRYQIDLSKQDFFTAVIDLRSDVKAEMKQHAKSTAEWERLDSLQRALKLLANSTSYGVLVEVDQAERTHERKPVTVYDGDGERVVQTEMVERPGVYFAGAVGTLIPAGGRLLLGIAEKLASERGFSIAFCDTDGLAFSRPEGMDRDEFRRRVKEIIEWFTPLSPYRGRPPILELEDANQWEGEAEPLYFLGISAKRYVLYNRCPDGTFRIRKFSSHGTGTWRNPRSYAPRADFPEPCEVDEDGKADSFKLGGPRYLYDLWYHAIEQAESGRTHITLDDADWLDEPAERQVTISTKHLYHQLAESFPGLRPYNFFTVLPALDAVDIQFRHLSRCFDTVGNPLVTGEPSRYDGLRGVGFYQSPDGLRRLDTHQLVDDETCGTGDVQLDRPSGLPEDVVLVQLSDGSMVERWSTDADAFQPKTLRECLCDYFQHPEAKAANPRGIGQLERQHLVAVEKVLIGKETNQVWLDLDEESDGVISHPDAQEFGRYGLAHALQAHSVLTVARAISEQKEEVDVDHVPLPTLYAFANGKSPSRGQANTILKALDVCAPARGCCGLDLFAN